MEKKSKRAKALTKFRWKQNHMQKLNESANVIEKVRR